MKNAGNGAVGIFFDDSAVEGVMELTEREAGRLMRQLFKARKKAPTGTMVHVTAARCIGAEELRFSWHLEPTDEVGKAE